MIDANLDKVVTHGKRADSIVKNMLLHSREGSGERTSVNVNAMVEEALNLAYHGARAEKPGFKVTIEKSLDPDAGSVDLYRAGDDARAPEPDFQRLLRHDQTRAGRAGRDLRAHDHRLDPRSRRPRRDRHPGQRNRHSRRGEGENVQPVLHHQARRRRHRASASR